LVRQDSKRNAAIAAPWDRQKILATHGVPVPDTTAAAGHVRSSQLHTREAGTGARRRGSDRPQFHDAEGTDAKCHLHLSQRLKWPKLAAEADCEANRFVPCQVVCERAALLDIAELGHSGKEI